MRDTRAATNTLKGLAILVVMLNHFIHANVTTSVGGIAYTFLAVFFWVSGWGVQLSLERRGVADNARTALMLFWRDRLLRLLPLYFVAIVARDTVLGAYQSPLSYFNIYGEGHLWFVPAIINCYLLAPLLYFLLRRWRLAALVAFGLVTIMGTGLLMGGMVPASVAEVLDSLQLVYKRAFLLHVFIFFMGMFAASEQQRIVRFSPSSAGFGIKGAYFILFAAFPLGYWIVKNLLHGAAANLGQLVMLGLPLLLCLLGVRHGVAVSWIARVGVVSYGFYLLHMTYFNLLHRLGLPRGLGELAVAVVMLPLLYVVVSVLEKGAGKLAKSFS